MNTVPNGDDSRRAQAQATVQTYAKVAGILFLLSVVGGGFGEAYAPSKLIVAGNATATAENVRALGSLFRMGFAGYLLEASADIGLALAFYVLLKPVNKSLALLAAFFGLVSTAVFAGAELFYFAPSLVLGNAGYLKTFSPDQLNTLAYLSFRLYVNGAALFTSFYGVAWVVRGYLIFRSGYLPRFLGVLLTVGGLGFIVRNFLFVLAPAYATDLFLAALFPGGLALMLWLLVRGVDLPKWEVKVAASASRFFA